jgi:transketolase C-terminal domain/subunit
VAETLAESTISRVPFKRLGLPPAFTSLVGSQEFLKEAYSLSVDGILKTLRSWIYPKLSNRVYTSVAVV